MKALVIVSIIGLISFMAMAKETTTELNQAAPMNKPVGPNMEPIKYIPNLTAGK